ncbi:MAG: 4Fe-4S binding protein [Methanosarcinales archaeon]|nr:4Fe-4S binding protein [Methanosarcinales archaeon]
MVIIKYESDGITIEIRSGKCIGCARCVDICPVGVFELDMKKGYATAPNVEECTKCCLCVDSCFAGAITHSSCSKSSIN